jgi:delta(3,5)-delta(2,4)-dienoyl-CoA isomerase
MAEYTFEYFTVRFPADHQYVAHVEINRPDRLNAFVEAWVLTQSIAT